eukprot:SAG11_NODE_13433_length_655_cov_1.196043_2_plen_90_part_00
MEAGDEADEDKAREYVDKQVGDLGVARDAGGEAEPLLIDASVERANIIVEDDLLEIERHTCRSHRHITSSSNYLNLRPDNCTKKNCPGE